MPAAGEDMNCESTVIIDWPILQLNNHQLQAVLIELGAVHYIQLILDLFDAIFDIGTDLVYSGLVAFSRFLFSFSILKDR